jgi:protein ImuA
VDAVLAWLPQVRPEQLRRLQWAAAEHHKLLFVLRPSAAQAQASPAVLRLLLCLDDSAALSVQILKRRGPVLAQPLLLDLPQPPSTLRISRADLPLHHSRAPIRSPEPVPAAPLTLLSTAHAPPPSSLIDPRHSSLPRPPARR